jgi:hypothetical protein
MITPEVVGYVVGEPVLGVAMTMGAGVGLGTHRS